MSKIIDSGSVEEEIQSNSDNNKEIKP